MSLTAVEVALELRVGKRLVFTNGVFDIIHAGHIDYLTKARQLGDLLIVGLNSDASVRLLNKAPDRPINAAEDRAAVLAALRAVDAVVLFEEATPVTIISALKPEIHVKGGDYHKNQLPETILVESYGGEVVILPFLPGRSTTSILKKLEEK